MTTEQERLALVKERNEIYDKGYKDGQKELVEKLRKLLDEAIN